MMQLLAIAIFVLLSPSVSQAACTAPNGSEGNVVYNTTHKTMQFCDGSNWHSMKGGGGLRTDCDVGDIVKWNGTLWQCADPFPPSGCPSIGDVCSDGSVYAGISQDGNVPMYTTPLDGGIFTWNDGTTNYIDTSMVNCSPTTTPTCSTGQENTQLLANIDLTPSPAPYSAAQYCQNLNAHGRTDWYLPAHNEIITLFNNRTAIGGWVSATYWSSSERNASLAWRIAFNGNSNADSKDTNNRVRCVRR